MGRKLLAGILGVIIFFWVGVGFLRFYDQNVQDVSLVRTFFWLLYFGGLALLILLAALLWKWSSSKRQ